MRLLVFGPRDWKDSAYLRRMIDGHLPVDPKEITLVNGQATGADTMARVYFLELGLPVDDFPALWRATCPDCYIHRVYKQGYDYCPAQGPIRNQKMLDSGIDYAIGMSWLPMSSGTQDMFDRLVAAGIDPEMHYRSKALGGV